jgi:hypothetical protein
MRWYAESPIHWIVAVCSVALLMLAGLSLADLAGPPSGSRPQSPTKAQLTGQSEPQAQSQAQSQAGQDVATGKAARAQLAEAGALATLADWDRRRAAAYADADPGALRRLYSAGSGAVRADLSILRGYLDRGLRVEGLRMQVLDLRVLTARPNRMRLAVTDRVARAVAVAAGSGARWPLPRDRATARVLTLVRAGGEWRVLEVRSGG